MTRRRLDTTCTAVLTVLSSWGAISCPRSVDRDLPTQYPVPSVSARVLVNRPVSKQPAPSTTTARRSARAAPADEEAPPPDDLFSGEPTVQVETTSGERVTVSCGRGLVRSVEPRRDERFVVLHCVDGNSDAVFPFFRRVFDTDRGTALAALVVEFSPNGQHVVIVPLGAQEQLHLVRVDRLGEFIAGHGQSDSMVLPRGSYVGCVEGRRPRVEYEAWITGAILRFTVGDCGTEHVIDYCLEDGEEQIVQRHADASDGGRARRRAQVPLPSPCAR